MILSAHTFIVRELMWAVCQEQKNSGSVFELELSHSFSLFGHDTYMHEYVFVETVCVSMCILWA